MQKVPANVGDITYVKLLSKFYILHLILRKQESMDGF